MLNVADINHDRDGLHRFRSRRHTNPLDPRYVFDCERRSGLGRNRGQMSNERNKNVVGPVDGSAPCWESRFTHKSANQVDNSLRTGDILGAQINLNKWDRNYEKDPNNVRDIPRCTPHSVKCFTTKRRTNPLDPQYKLASASVSGTKILKKKDKLDNNSEKNDRQNKTVCFSRWIGFASKTLNPPPLGGVKVGLSLF